MNKINKGQHNFKLFLFGGPCHLLALDSVLGTLFSSENSL